MITLNTKDGDIKFNLGTGFPREIALCQTITRLQSEKSGATINITTSDKEKLSIRIPDVTDLKFSEAEYIKAEIYTKKEKVSEQSEEDMVDQLLKGRNKYKRRKIETFLRAVRKKTNKPINPDDPMLQNIIDKL